MLAPGSMMMRQVYYECVLNGVCKSGMDGASRLYYGGARTRDDSQYFERSRESAPVRLIVCSMSGGEREELFSVVENDLSRPRMLSPTQHTTHTLIFSLLLSTPGHLKSF